MLFKPDFYGKNVDVLDRLIEIGSKEDYIKGTRTHDAFREVVAKSTLSGNLNDFLKYNMELFTKETDLNDWFIKATKDNVYIVEPETTNPAFASAKHRAYEGLNNDVHGKMILPLLNLKDAHMFLISTYNTMAYSSFEKYGKNTEAERNAFKAEIDKVAKGQQNYLDFWSRLATDKVRNQLLKSNNMVPTLSLITKTTRALVQTVMATPTVAKMSLQFGSCMVQPIVTMRQIGGWEQWREFTEIHIKTTLSSSW